MVVLTGLLNITCDGWEHSGTATVRSYKSKIKHKVTYVWCI